MPAYSKLSLPRQEGFWTSFQVQHHQFLCFPIIERTHGCYSNLRRCAIEDDA